METSNRKELDKYRHLLEGLDNLRQTMYINRSGNKEELSRISLNKVAGQSLEKETEEQASKPSTNTSRSEIETFSYSSVESLSVNNRSKNQSTLPTIPIINNYFASPYRDHKYDHDRHKTPEYAKKYFEKRNQNMENTYSRYKYF